MAYTARSALNTRNGRLAYLPATAATAAKTDRQNASRIESAPRFSIVISASLLPAAQRQALQQDHLLSSTLCSQAEARFDNRSLRSRLSQSLETLANLVSVQPRSAETSLGAAGMSARATRERSPVNELSARSSLAADFRHATL